MGNSQTKKAQDGAAAAPAHTGAAAKEVPSPLRPRLTDDQKKIIQETWKILEEDIAKVGIIVFINLFETHPDMQNVFLPFTGIVLEELKQSKQLSAHALRVMGAVQKAVARLFEPDKLEALLKELGRNHVAYGAKIEYMDYIGPQFIAAIQPSLESKWTPEVEDAWHTLLAYVVAVIKEAMREAENLNKRTQLDFNLESLISSAHGEHIQELVSCWKVALDPTALLAPPPGNTELLTSLDIIRSFFEWK